MRPVNELRISVRWRRNAARISRCREQMIRARMRAKMAVMMHSLRWPDGRSRPGCPLVAEAGRGRCFQRPKICPRTPIGAGNRGPRYLARMLGCQRSPGHCRRGTGPIVRAFYVLQPSTPIGKWPATSRGF